MSVYICQGRHEVVAPGLVRLFMEVNGITKTMLTVRGSNHDAAYRAQQMALRMARADGCANPVIRNSSRVVTFQMRGTWRARKNNTRHHLASCRHAAVGMRPFYRT